MKKIVFLLCSSLLFSAWLSGEEPETLKVNAKGGLKVRSAPGQKGKAMGTLKFGEEIAVSGFAGKTEKIGKVSGKWAKINYNNKDGFVFAGFLSDFLAFDVNHANEQVCVAVEIYRDKNGIERGKINNCGPGGMADECRSQLVEEAKARGYDFCGKKMDKKTEKMFCDIIQQSSGAECASMTADDRRQQIENICGK